MNKPEKIQRVHVKGGYGGVIEAAHGQYICVLDLYGGQCVDFWAIDPSDFDHFLSPPYCWIDWMRIQPKVGDKLLTNRRVDILTLLADDVGWHDMLVPSCDKMRYERYFGVKGHRNCVDNFREAMVGYPWGTRAVPHPFNIFMNTVVNEDSTMEMRVPTSKAGDRVIMKTEMDVIAVVSACPMDLNETGARGVTDIEILVSDDFDALRNA